MENDHIQIETFFHSYEKTFNESLAGNINYAATANIFADCFIAANPSGVSCGINNDSFLKTIILGYNYYISCGVKTMNIVSQCITRLNEIHFLDKVKWESYYEVNENKHGMIEFEVIYFIRKIDGRFLVFGYITGDEKKAFQEKGLFPTEKVNLDEGLGLTPRYPRQQKEHSDLKQILY